MHTNKRIPTLAFPKKHFSDENNIAVSLFIFIW